MRRAARAISKLNFQFEGGNKYVGQSYRNEQTRLPLGDQGSYWNQHRFESMKTKTPDTHVRVRTPSGEVKTLCLSDLAFHSEAIFTERRY